MLCVRINYTTATDKYLVFDQTQLEIVKNIDLIWFLNIWRQFSTRQNGTALVHPVTITAHVQYSELTDAMG